MQFILALLIWFSTSTLQQDDPVLIPVRNLFTGMETGDSTLVRNAFWPEAQMKSVVITENRTEIRDGDLNRFVRVIGTSTRALVEPIWNIKVEKDGRFAQVWADYALYVDGKFSHCGVDAFQLAQFGEEWKIIAITDTRRTANCVIPSEVKSKHEK